MVCHRVELLKMLSNVEPRRVEVLVTCPYRLITPRYTGVALFRSIFSDRLSSPSDQLPPRAMVATLYCTYELCSFWGYEYAEHTRNGGRVAQNNVPGLGSGEGYRVPHVSGARKIIHRSYRTNAHRSSSVEEPLPPVSPKKVLPKCVTAVVARTRHWARLRKYQ